MTAKESPIEGYKRHIAHANLIIYKEVITNITNQNNNERQ